MRDFPPTHPGEILIEEFLKPMGISQYRLAKGLTDNNFYISKLIFRPLTLALDKHVSRAGYLCPIFNRPNLRSLNHST